MVVSRVASRRQSAMLPKVAAFSDEERCIPKMLSTWFECDFDICLSPSPCAFCGELPSHKFANLHVRAEPTWFISLPEQP